MRLEQLKYAVLAAEYQSFSKASEKLFISPQALSRSMAMLEHELGVEIFIPFTTGVKLTEKGEIIIAFAKRVLKDYEQTICLINLPEKMH